MNDVTHSGFRVLVTGGRNFRDTAYIYGVLDGLNALSMIRYVIVGDARGVDHRAQEWAVSRGIRPMVFRADWQRWGKAAGHMRNQDMVDMKPSLCVAFPGGAGTADCVQRARIADILVYKAKGV